MAWISAAIGIVSSLFKGGSKRKSQKAKAEAEERRRQQEYRERESDRNFQIQMAQNKSSGMTKSLPMILGGVGILGVVVLLVMKK